MEETGLSKSHFSQLLVDFSRWYDGLCYINMLKVLYNNRDHVPIYNKLNEATKVMPLLSMLIGSGNLSPTNLTILYDTIKATGQFGFNSRIVLPPLQRIREHKVSKFSWYRQFLLKLGMALTEDDIVALDVQFNMPVLENYKDSWHLILDLEQRNELCEEKIDDFIEGLPSYLAVKALLEGTREASTSNRPKLNEVDRRTINRQADETYTSYYNRLKENIRQSNMYIRKDVRGDGNCFLYCIQDQLERLGLPNRSSAQLRADLVDYLRRLDEKDPLVTLIDDKYLDEFSKDGTYVDEIAVRAMSRILNHDFHIVTSQRISTEQGYLVTKIHESSNPDGVMLFGQIGELHYISLGYGGPADGMGESGKSSHQLPPARQSLLPQQLQQLQAQILAYNYLAWNQPIPDSLRSAVQGNCPMQSLQRPSPGYGGPADGKGESTMSSHQQQPPPARLSLLPQQPQQPQAQIPAYNYLAWNQPIPDSLRLAVQSNCPMQNLQRPSSDLIIKDFLITKLKQLYKDVNQMTPAIWHKHHKVNIAKVFTELILLKSTRKDKGEPNEVTSTCIRKEGRPTSLTEVLGIIKTDSCKVLITGKGGMGKTTLLKYITYKWATDDVHNAFAGKLLFLINIEDIKASTTFLDVIMKNIVTEELFLQNNLPPDSVKKFLVNHADDIVILLDGYDELQRDAKDPIYLFKGLELEKSTVVITSRPDNTIDLVECCTIHIEVNGFSSKNIKEYIENHFHSINKCELGELLIKEFKLDLEYKEYWGHGHKEAFQLCSSPLLLLMICTIWEQKLHLPKDLSDLFKDLICCILSQYKSRSDDKTAIFQIERIPNQYRLAILLLGECMYEGLKENKLSIDKYVLSKMTKNLHSVDLALELGFVYEDSPFNPGDTREIYTPTHKLISEALAGFYLANQIEKEHLKYDEYELIRSNEYLNMTRVFTIGFLGDKVGKLLKHWLILRASHFYSIAQCFKYIKEENEELVLEELKKLSTEMKSYCEQMRETFRSVLEDDKSKSEHLFKLMKRCCIKYAHHPETIEEKVLSLVDTSSEETFRKSCSSVVHISVIVQGLIGDGAYSRRKSPLFEYISNWEDKKLNVVSAEMKYLQLNYSNTNLSLYFEFNSSFLIHLLTHSNNLSALNVVDGLLTEAIFSVVINELHKTNVTLKLTKLNISDTDLHNIDGALLGKLFEIAPELNTVNVSRCRLSVSIVNEMMEECGRMNVVLNDNMLNLEGNDLSDIDGKSLAGLVRVMFYPFRWSEYSLTADNLKKLIESVGENMTLNWKKIDLSKINLSSISGKTLACLYKISPDLIHINMSHCSLSVSIVNEMMEECGRINVVLKDNMLDLEGNDLSDIDGKSLAGLVRVMFNPFIWSEYSLTADNLKKLIESVGENMTLNWKKIDLSEINLSSISGKTLACLFNISPDLIHINMSHCSLSVSIVNEMMEECGRMNVVWKDNMLRLEGNDLSDIDGKSLAGLVRVMFNPFIWSEYSLTADNLQTLVESVGVNETFNWKKIDLSKINLSSISGRTLACLFNIFPDLIHINMNHCSLSGSIVNEMMEECGRMNVVLQDNMLRLEGNDLSGIDGKSLAGLVRGMFDPFRWSKYSVRDKILKMLEPGGDYNKAFKWSNYSLTADNLQTLVESVGVNETFNWKRIDLSKINLSSISGKTLACLFKISPDLIDINMSHCSLSGSIVNEMMEECGRMNVVLKDNMLRLKGNDLSDIDGKSLAELVNLVMFHPPFTWSEYSLTAYHLKKLIESVGENKTLNWEGIDLSGINLSSISGKTLACLCKISPYLFHINMSHCSLSVSIVNEMMEECGRMNVVLKDNMLRLKGNDLSDIDGKSLAELVRVMFDHFTWSEYSLTAYHLQKLVESVGENMTLNGKRIDLSEINLSSISSKTLACLFKISPDLIHMDMSYCSLSGSIVNEMMEECGRMNVVLKDNMLRLEGNDLSDIDGKSLVELLRVMYYHYDTFTWIDYCLTTDNLQKMIKLVGVNKTELGSG